MSENERLIKKLNERSRIFDTMKSLNMGATVTWSDDGGFRLSLGDTQSQKALAAAFAGNKPFNYLELLKRYDDIEKAKEAAAKIDRVLLDYILKTIF